MMRKTLPLVVLIMLALVVASCNLPSAQPPAPEPAAPAVQQAAPTAAPAPPAALPMEYIGIYTAQLPAADSPGRNITVELTENGAVTVTSDYLNGEPPIVETGAWQASADGTVTAVITAQGDKAYFEPVAFILQLSGDELVATREGQAGSVSLMRSTGEQAEAPAPAEASAPAATAPVSGTLPMTTTASVTATAPLTPTAPVTVAATTAVTPTTAAGISATAEIIVENAYLGIRRTASDGGSALVALSLNQDGTAQYGTDFHDNQPSIIEVGTWVDNGDGTLTVTLTGRADRQYDEPNVITFAREDDLLKTVEYDQAIFGTEGLTLRLAADVAGEIEHALVTIDLEAGFPLDPTFVSVNGGGEVDASLLGAGCSGFINDTPVVTINWTGEADFVEAFFVSDHDPTLVVLTPDGRFLCNDDANDQLLDPVIEMQDPVAGTYRIWVGSYDKGQLLPGVLVLTTRPDVNIGTFNLSALIKRPALAEVLPEPTPSVDTESLISKPLQQKLDQMVIIGPGAEPIVQQLTVEGSVPAFELPVVGARCGGFVADVPDFIFAWEGEALPLRIYFEGDRDASLLVVNRDLEIICNDDTEPGANTNPLIDIAAATPGPYIVFVGRLDPSTPVSGTLTITTAPDAAPVQLGPVQ